MVAAWLIDLNLCKYEILEIGCGNGYFGKVLIEMLQKSGVEFSYHFTDFLPECVKKTEETISVLDDIERITVSKMDVFDMDSRAAESKNIIVSREFVSAASYRDAIPHVARVLKKDGILICDFVNHFSPLVFLSRPLRLSRKLLHALYSLITGEEREKIYYFGLIGITYIFNINNLKLVKHRTIRLRLNPLI